MTDSNTRPDDAWWSAEDDEWVHGDRDGEGRLIGVVRYWDKAGAFISECDHRAGKPHGSARRFYADGSLEQDCTYVEGVITGVRRMHRPGTDRADALPVFTRLDDAVAVYECHYEDGNLIGTLTRDGEGNEIGSHDGEPVPERPPGVPPTATSFQGGWLFMRRQGEDGKKVLETREFYGDGTIKEERLPDGTNRSLHPGGAVASEGQRIDHEGRRPEHGWWRYGDAAFIRRESRFEFGVEQERRWHRPLHEAAGGAITAQGPVCVIGRDAFESGEWAFMTDGGDTEARFFGEPQDEESLLGDRCLVDEVPDEVLEAVDAVGPAARIARIRLAGRRRDEMLLRTAIHLGAPWSRINSDGDPLGGGGLPHLMSALLFRRPLESLGRLAAYLFAKDRPRAALDVADAALCLPADDEATRVGQEALRVDRVSYLRSLGEDELVAAALRSMHGGRDVEAEVALLLRLRGEPKSNELRLAFASLVAEAEPDHAALIRIDCGGDTADERSALLRRIEVGLPETLRGATAAIDGGFFDLDSFHYLQGKDFLEHHETLFRWAPFTERLDLWFASEQVAQLAVLPSLRRYTTLNFWDACLFWGRAAQLARSPHLGQLEVLGLYDANLYDDDLIAVLRSTSYPALRELNIGNQREGQDYTFEGFKVLAESVFAPTLEVLRMNRRYFSEDITAVLGALPRLHHLEIEGLDWGNVGLLGLAELGRDWTHLKIDRCGVGAGGIEALSTSEGMRALTFLDIGSNKIGEGGLNTLLASPLTNLKSLFVGGSECGVGEAFGRGLIEAPMSASLEELGLSLARLGPRGAVALARAPLHELRRLNLHLNGVGDDGAKAIAGSESLRRLRFLDLSQNDLTDEGGKALAASPHLESLEWLELGGAELSKGVQKALKERFGDHVYFKYPWNRR